MSTEPTEPEVSVEPVPDPAASAAAPEATAVSAASEGAVSEQTAEAPPSEQGAGEVAAAAESAVSESAGDDGAPAQDASAEQAAEPRGNATEGAEGIASEGQSEASGEQVAAEQAEGEGESSSEAAPAEDGETQAATGEGEEGATPGKRRRKKKKKKKEAPVGPLARFFAQGAARTHAFAVGEVVAGRVTRVGDGVVAVDLFGKAVAFADEREPEWSPPSDPPAPDVAATEAAATEAAPTADGETQADAVASSDEAATPEAQTAADADAAPEAQAEATDDVQAQSAVPTQDAAAADATDASSQQPAVTDEANVAQSQEAISADETSASQPEAPVDEAAPSSDETAATQDATADAVVSEPPSDGTAQDATDDDADAGDTLAGATVKLPPMPVVADEQARSEPASVATVYRGNVGAVSESGHIAILNRKVDVAKVRAELEQARESRRRVQGLVFGFNRGGFDVVVAGMRAFAPASAMALGEIADPEALIGKRFEFLLPLGQPVNKGIIVTRRAILEREQRKRARELARALEPGQRVKGHVTQVLAFGVVVDLGGVDGLVHQSELSYAPNVQPADVAKVGDEVEVQVLKIEEAGKKSGRDRLPRLSLSLRALQPDPWEEHKAILAEGTIQKGKVAGLAEFGAFIELAPAVQGLLHVSELGKDLPHADRALKLDEEIHVVLERVDRKARRISLSRPSPSEVEDHEAGKLTGSGPPPNLKQGARIKVKVERVEHAGIIVRVAGVVGKRARGFISKRDLGEGSGDLRKRFAQGSEIDVKVLGTDRQGGLRCSVRALQVDDERAAVRDYRKAAATEGFGTFGDLLRQKLDTPAK